MMGRIANGLRAFGAFWWDFIVGDDWRVAVGVVVALAVTGFLAAKDLPAWWFLPLAVLALLTASLARAVRAAGIEAKK
jgi:hypothetical protein